MEKRTSLNKGRRETQKIKANQELMKEIKRGLSKLKQKAKRYTFEGVFDEKPNLEGNLKNRRSEQMIQLKKILLSKKHVGTYPSVNPESWMRKFRRRGRKIKVKPRPKKFSF